MRVVIASRIFAPEPAAAAFRLGALANELAARGHEVVVVTSRGPQPSGDEQSGAVRVRRAPVLRDRSGAVRGYLPYLSFDLPLFWRLLFSRRPELYVVEPPPTTGIVVWIIAALTRRPFVYFAADVLADAAQGAGSPPLVVRIVRGMERHCWRSARRVLAVSSSVRSRLVELGVPEQRISVVGNGVDTEVFTPHGDTVVRPNPYVLYAGTASEVHGAGVFVEAMAHVPSGDLVFLGSGTDMGPLAERAAVIAPSRVVFLPTVASMDAATWFRGAALAVASVRPGGHYDFAFPTKLYAASACGAPVLFCGPGPGATYARESPSGTVVDPDPLAVAAAIREAVEAPRSHAQRLTQASWARERVSLREVASRSSDAIEAAVREGAS
jgi:glycosyltransferase involved in cell wall biosynthesis